MGLLEQAKTDIEQITSNLDEWGRVMTFALPGIPIDLTFDQALNSNQMVTMVGLHTKHHLGMNEDMRRVNTKNASVTVSEKFFTDVAYPVRNSNHEVAMQGHQVVVKDSTGLTCLYVVREWFPDETVGLIVFILGDAE